eukprot:2147408-Rhodomonas_salina.1
MAAVSDCFCPTGAYLSATGCHRCPLFSSTNGPDTVGLSGCFCLAGYYMRVLPPAFECLPTPVGSFT